MKVLHPIPVTDAVLTASSIPETDYPEWLPATPYTAGQRVIVVADHKCYEALSDSTGQAPAENPTIWLDLGATNRWAAFDKKVGTKSTATTTMSFTLAPGLINAIGLVGCDAGTVQIVMTDPTYGEVFNQTYSMSRTISESSYWTYFYEPRGRKTTLIVDDLPTSRAPVVTVTLTVPTGQPVSLGALLVGRMHKYDRAVRTGASVGLKDFSRKGRDGFGNWEIVERTWSRRAEWDFILKNSDMDAYVTRMASLRSTPALFIGGPYDVTVVYGFYLDTRVVIPYPQHSECSIEIEGLEED